MVTPVCDYYDMLVREAMEKHREKNNNPRPFHSSGDIDLIEFFRHCPGCGKRFHIKLEKKEIVQEDTKMIPTKRVIRPIVAARTGWQTYKGGSAYVPPPIIRTELVEGPPIIVKEEEFQHTYKCGHCGHEWTELHREHKEGSVEANMDLIND